MPDNDKSTRLCETEPPQKPRGLWGKIRAFFGAWMNTYPGCSSCRSPWANPPKDEESKK